MIFDEVHEDADRKIAEAITGFLFKTNFGRSFHHILEMPLFVSSAVTPAVQFADIFAGIVRHYYENELDQKEPDTELCLFPWLLTVYSGSLPSYMMLSSPYTCPQSRKNLDTIFKHTSNFKHFSLILNIFGIYIMFNFCFFFIKLLYLHFYTKKYSP